MFISTLMKYKQFILCCIHCIRLIKKSLNLFLLLIIFVSCDNNEIDKKWEIIKLPELSHVTIDSFNIPQVNKYPVDMIRRNNTLVIRNINSDTIYRVFALPDLKYLGWFGKIGKGPKEFLLAPHIRNYNSFIQLSGVRKISLINLPYGNVANNFKIIEEYPVPGNIHPLNETFTLNDNKYYGIVFGGRKIEIDKRKELVFFDTEIYTTGSLIDFPSSLYKGIPNTSFMHPKHITVSPNNDKFAFFYTLYPLIRIFNKKAEIINEVWVNGLPKQIKFKNLASKASNDKVPNLALGYNYYDKVISTEKYLYALFRNDKGIKTGPEKFSYGRESISNPELHVFTWGGKPIYRIQMRKNTSAFELSLDEKYLYSVDLNMFDKIFRYNLKECTRK